MRLLDILYKSSERWRMGLEQLKRNLGYGSKSRRIAEQQATIVQLRDKLHLSELRVEFLETTIRDLKLELGVHKNATANMWKFIHTRHRLNTAPVDGSIDKILRKAGKR